MYICVAPDSPVPIFTQIRDRIVREIATGALTPWKKLGPVRAVATAGLVVAIAWPLWP